MSLLWYPAIEYIRNVRRGLKLWEWFLNKDVLPFDEDRPYLIPAIDVGITPKTEIYSDDGVKLYRYNPVKEKLYRTPLVIVYALINKPYILDLTPERSVIRKFLNAGFDVYLIKWGDATIADQFSLNEYVDIFLYDFIDEVRNHAGVNKVSILGYCMGGGLTAMYSALYPENVKNLIFLASTLYFDKTVGGMVKLSDRRFFNPENVVAPFGYVPARFLAERFKMLRPLDNYFTKYINLFLNAENEKLIDDFFRMERWIHDGVNVAAGAYVRYVEEMYQNNALCEGKLFINGKKVDPKNIKMPVAAVVGKRDHLAPAEQTIKFLEFVGSKDKKIFEADAGHVGLVVSRRAMKLWEEVAEWLGKRSGKLSGNVF
ncbi:class III poly(R)-hydroxyalkanoic acid synthase subunit PhaC [Archaeoglobales archaeon]|nr:MAG: class III poly(R)-hydroxyalkanoic acid synthase subunit PhaC [Archaeoglobales archaeon]